MHYLLCVYQPDAIIMLISSFNVLLLWMFGMSQNTQGDQEGYELIFISLDLASLGSV